MKLPPLNAVRAFESAARQGSFRLAAAELFVTPGAISQQIRQLETWLGISLFDRLPRAVRLTPAGQEFYAASTRHLRGLAQAAERLRPRADTVMISVVPTFASRWLMPRLSHFTQLHPTVEVRVDASPVLVDFDNDRFDLSVRQGRGGYLGVESKLLFSESMVSLCSRSYRTAHFDNQPPARAWKSVRLLHENAPDDFWPAWMASRGLTEVNADAGLYFSHGLLVLSAAIESQGVALQPREFVERELASGALVLPDERKFDTGRGYYLVWPKRNLSAGAERFRDWLMNEIGSVLGAAPQEARANS